MSFLRESLTDKQKNAAVARLDELASDLGGTVAQLAIAWVIKNPNVSSAILGASKPAQLTENLKSIALLPKLTTDVLGRIEEITRPHAR
jgi:aryl-alcohol dehydrogenase-like predicted oxidoreductase